MPEDGPEASGVPASAQVRPPSLERSTRDSLAAPVPTQTWFGGSTATLVPLAAKKPSFGSAGGSAAAGTRVHVAPPSVVVRMTNWPFTESLIATPRVSSQNAMASKNAFGSVLTNCSIQVAPVSRVL
jgi:hypothetical protein